MENSTGMKPIHLPHYQHGGEEGGRGCRCEDIDCCSVSLSSLHDQIYFLKGAWEKLLGEVLLEKMQHSRCGPAATEGQAARCRAESRAFVRRWRRAATTLRPFSPPVVVSSNQSVCIRSGLPDQSTDVVGGSCAVAPE